MKGTLCWEGLLSAAPCPILLRPQKQSTAAMSFQTCLAVGTGAGMRASGVESIPFPLTVSAQGAGSRLRATNLQRWTAGAKLVVVLEGFPELC